MRVLGYARCSTDEQAARSEYNTIDSQRDRLEQFCTYQSTITGEPWRLVAMYTDEGYSGKNTRRPGYRELVRAVEAREGDAVAVYKLDRITRSLYDFLHMDAAFARSGVSIVSVKEQFDTSTPIGRALRALLLVFAQLERETTVERVRDKMQNLVQSGRFAGRPTPYGYMRTDAGVLVPHPGHAAVVERIFEMYADEGLGTAAIASRLNAEGVPAPHGARWRGDGVALIVRNAAHRGRQVFGEWEGAWPFETVIDTALAARAQKIDTQRRWRRGPTTIRHEWQFLGVCAYCKSTLRRSESGSKSGRYVYLACSRERHRQHDKRMEKCPLLRVRLEWLDRVTAAVLDAVAKAQPAPRVAAPPDTAQRRAAIEERRRRATVSYNEPGSAMSDSDYRAILSDCDRQERALAVDVPADPRGYATLKDAWPGLGVADRNAALHALVDALVVSNEAVTVELKRTGWSGWKDVLAFERDDRPFAYNTG